MVKALAIWSNGAVCTEHEAMVIENSVCLGGCVYYMSVRALFMWKVDIKLCGIFRGWL